MEKGGVDTLKQQPEPHLKLLKKKGLGSSPEN